MHYTLNDIVIWFAHYKYLVIFPFAIFEGPIVTVISGFLAAQRVLNIYLVLAVVIAGDIVGDTFYYCLGRFGGRPFLLKWGKFVGVNEERVERTEVRFAESGTKILTFGKFQPYGSIILTAAGLARMPYLNFIWINFWTTSIKSVMLLALGYYFGQAYVLIDKYLNYFGLILTALGIGLLGIYFIYRYAKNRNHN